MSEEIVWEKFKRQIGTRIDTDHPPYRNVIIIFEGDEDSQMTEVIEIPDGAEDGILQLLVGNSSVSASLIWTIHREP